MRCCCMPAVCTASQAYPHVDECRQCKVCIPQSCIDQRLGNSSSSSRRWFGRLWARQLLQQQQQLEQHLSKRPQLHINVNSSGSSSSSGDITKTRRGRGGWAQQRQQWLAALMAAMQLDSSSSSSSEDGTLRDDAGDEGHQQQQEQQQRQPQQQQEEDTIGVRWQRRLQEPQPPQLQRQRPRLDGVRTHKAWLAKQAAGKANTDTHAGK